MRVPHSTAPDPVRRRALRGWRGFLSTDHAPPLRASPRGEGRHPVQATLELPEGRRTSDKGPGLLPGGGGSGRFLSARLHEGAPRSRCFSPRSRWPKPCPRSCSLSRDRQAARSQAPSPWDTRELATPIAVTTATLLRRYIVALLHHRIVTLLHCCIVTSLRCRVTTLLHHYVITSFMLLRCYGAMDH